MREVAQLVENMGQLTITRKVGKNVSERRIVRFKNLLLSTRARDRATPHLAKIYRATVERSVPKLGELTMGDQNCNVITLLAFLEKEFGGKEKLMQMRVGELPPALTLCLYEYISSEALSLVGKKGSGGRYEVAPIISEQLTAVEDEGGKETEATILNPLHTAISNVVQIADYLRIELSLSVEAGQY